MLLGRIARILPRKSSVCSACTRVPRAAFFCAYVVNWLHKDPVLGDTPKERRRTLNNGGLTINTTIDLDK